MKKRKKGAKGPRVQEQSGQAKNYASGDYDGVKAFSPQISSRRSELKPFIENRNCFSPVLMGGRDTVLSPRQKYCIDLTRGKMTQSQIFYKQKAKVQQALLIRKDMMPKALFKSPTAVDLKANQSMWDQLVMEEKFNNGPILQQDVNQMAATDRDMREYSLNSAENAYAFMSPRKEFVQRQ